jgi:CRISPR-associated protein Csx17
LANAVFDALTHDHTPARWQAILLAATDIEAIQVTGTAIEANPIPQLHPDWVTAVNDHSAEVRLALALGSAAAFFRRGRPADPVRHHWLPLDAGARRFKTADNRLIKDSRVVVSGRDSVRDLAAIVERRLIESEDGGQRRSGLIAAPRCGARLDDLAHFLAGEVDLDKLLGLARAFMALRWDTWKPEFHPAPKVPESTADSPGTKQLRETPGECWLAVRLACLPWKLTRDKDIPADPRMVRLLSSGDAGRALEIACRRLRSAGIRPPMQAGVSDRGIARLWAAALAFPISHNTALKCLARLDPRLDPKKGMQNA